MTDTPDVSQAESGSVTLELCAGSIHDVEVAATAGVPRIELNTALPLGGLTPSAGLLQAARARFPGTIIAMLRPREGGFCYTAAEYDAMLRDAELLLQCGADGFAAGFLRQDRHIDLPRCAHFRRAFGHTTWVFHRAFDLAPDLPLALRQLRDCGVDRILTSGGAATVEGGAAAVAELVALAGHAIEIVAGSGVRSSNACRILEHTGCRQLHASAGMPHLDPSGVHPRLNFSGQGQSPGSWRGASLTELRALQAAVASWRPNG